MISNSIQTVRILISELIEIQFKRFNMLNSLIKNKVNDLIKSAEQEIMSDLQKHITIEKSIPFTTSDSYIIKYNDLRKKFSKDKGKDKK